MSALLTLAKMTRVGRIRTWKQAILTVTVAWSLIVGTIALEQQELIVRALLPPHTVAAAGA